MGTGWGGVPGPVCAGPHGVGSRGECECRGTGQVWAQEGPLAARAGSKADGVTVGMMENPGRAWKSGGGGPGRAAWGQPDTATPCRRPVGRGARGAAGLRRGPPPPRPPALGAAVRAHHRAAPRGPPHAPRPQPVPQPQLPAPLPGCLLPEVSCWGNGRWGGGGCRDPFSAPGLRPRPLAHGPVGAGTPPASPAMPGSHT